ncbi:hypothetical protein V8C35DRAFT_167480 [Trichoderma chlorosporum]
MLTPPKRSPVRARAKSLLFSQCMALFFFFFTSEDSSIVNGIRQSSQVHVVRRPRVHVHAQSPRPFEFLQHAKQHVSRMSVKGPVELLVGKRSSWRL